MGLSSESDAFAAGVSLYTAGAFFEAHEAWEEIWRGLPADRPEERRVLQGLIQVAAAFHKLFAMHRPKSAARLLRRGVEKLADVAELAEFCAEARACADSVEQHDDDSETVDRVVAEPVALDRACVPRLRLLVRPRPT